MGIYADPPTKLRRHSSPRQSSQGEKEDEEMNYQMHFDPYLMEHPKQREKELATRDALAASPRAAAQVAQGA